MPIGNEILQEYWRKFLEISRNQNFNFFNVLLENFESNSFLYMIAFHSCWSRWGLWTKKVFGAVRSRKDWIFVSKIERNWKRISFPNKFFEECRSNHVHLALNIESCKVAFGLSGKILHFPAFLAAKFAFVSQWLENQKLKLFLRNWSVRRAF